jgi:hypothetical protein
MSDRPEHDPVLAERGECECFKCHIGAVNVGKPSDFATRTRVGRARTPNNSWERGVARGPRGLPVVKPDGSPMGVKEYATKRHLVEETQMRRAAIPRPA